MPPAHKAVFQAAVLGHHTPLKAHRLALVLFHLLGQVTVPHGKVRIGDLNDRGLNIKGQRVLYLIIIKVSVHIVIAYFGPAAHAPHHLVDLHFIGAHRGPVQQHHLTAGQLIHHQAAHICVVA